MIGQKVRHKPPTTDNTVLKEIDAIFAELEIVRDGGYGHLMDFRQRMIIEELINRYEGIKKKYNLQLGEKDVSEPTI